MSQEVNNVEWSNNHLNEIDRSSTQNVINVKNLLNSTGQGFYLAKIVENISKQYIFR